MMTIKLLILLMAVTVIGGFTAEGNDGVDSFSKEDSHKQSQNRYPSPKVHVKWKLFTITDRTKQMADAFPEALVSAKKKISGLKETAWAKAMELVNGAKQKATQMIEKLEGQAAYAAQSARKAIIEPTLASLEVINDPAHGANFVKESVQQGSAFVEEARRSVMESASKAVDAMNKTAQKIGHTAWETVSSICNATLKPAIRAKAVQTGHKFWNRIYRTNDMAKEAICQAKERSKKAAAMVFKQGAAALQRVKYGACQLADGEALAGRVPWCNIGADQQTKEVLDQACDVGNADDEIGKANRLFEGKRAERATVAVGGAFEVRKEDGKREGHSRQTENGVPFLSGGGKRGQETLDQVRSIVGNVVVKGSGKVKKHELKQVEKPNKNKAGNNNKDISEAEQNHKQKQELIRSERESERENAHGHSICKECTDTGFPEGLGISGRSTKDMNDTVQSKYEHWRERLGQLPEDMQAFVQEGWQLMEAAQREASGSRTLYRDARHSWFWVGLTSIIFLGSFCASLLFAFERGLDLPSTAPLQRLDLMESKIFFRCLRLVAISTSLCMAIIIQCCILQQSDLISQWQTVALSIALLGSTLNWLLFLPQVEKAVRELRQIKLEIRESHQEKPKLLQQAEMECIS